MIVRTTAPLGDYPKRATDRLVYWAERTPRKTMLAWRGRGGDWETLTYGAALARSGASARHSSSAGCPQSGRWRFCRATTAIIALLSLAAQHVGVTVAPVSPAYSLSSRDFAMLKHAMAC